MKRLARLTLSTCVLLAAWAGVASAQTDGTFAIGASVSTKIGTADGTSGHVGPALLWRFGHGRDGWGWSFGMGWYRADLSQPVETQAAASPFGELKVRPFMGGYGYSKRVGRRTTLAATLFGGYAFNSFDLHPTFDDAYRQMLGAGMLTTDVSNSFVVKPEVSAWVDLSRKVGLNFSAGYLVSRPDVTVSSTLGKDTRHINADVMVLKIGAVYSVF